MKTSAFRILAVSAAAALLLTAACKQQDKPDPAEFAALCDEVVKCDKQTAGFPDATKICGQMLAGVKEKFPERLPDLKACLDSQSCEEKSFAVCVADLVQGAGLVLPEQ